MIYEQPPSFCHLALSTMSLMLPQPRCNVISMTGLTTQTLYHHLAGRSVSVAAIVAVCALGTAAVVDVGGRSILSPVRHTLSLVTVAPVASVATVAVLAEDLLLGPDSVALGVVPCAGRGIRSRFAARLLGRDGDTQAHAELLELETNFGADGLRSTLAVLSASQLGGNAGAGTGAVDVASGLLPRQVLDRRIDNEVVPPALANPGELVGVRDAI